MTPRPWAQGVLGVQDHQAVSTEGQATPHSGWPSNPNIGVLAPQQRSDWRHCT